MINIRINKYTNVKHNRGALSERKNDYKRDDINEI